jgi:hypothetical protein
LAQLIIRTERTNSAIWSVLSTNHSGDVHCTSAVGVSLAWYLAALDRIALGKIRRRWRRVSIEVFLLMATLAKYGFQIAFYALLVFGVLGIFFIQSGHGESIKNKHPRISRLLLLPLILDADKEKRDGVFFTKREWMGWGLVAALIAIGVLFAS